MKRYLGLLCIILSLILMVSCGKNNVIDFEMGMSYEEIETLCADDDFFGEDKTYNMVSYKRENIKFFENEEVVSMFYFTDDELSKVIYDVSDCSAENIDEMVSYFDDNFEQVSNKNETLGGYPYSHIEWEDGDMNITYEKITMRNTSQIKFYFKNKDL